MITATFNVRLNRLPVLATGLKPKLNDAVHAAGFSWVGKAQGRARRDTGYMAGSTNAQPGDLQSRISAPAAYSGFLDAGTRYITGDKWFSGPASEVGAELEAALGAIFG